MPIRVLFIFIMLLFILVGCAPKRPTLYPNAQLEQVGEVKAQQEIDACQKLAEASGAKDDKVQETAKNTAGAATIGAVSGAAWGVFSGDAGRGAAAGAAAGAAGALVHGVIKSGDPGVIYRGFVDRCLREKGFDVIGWR